jgi:hypothetical protein
LRGPSDDCTHDAARLVDTRPHPLIQEYLIGIELPTVKRGKQRFVYRYRRLRDGSDAITVNWFGIQIINAKGETTYRNSAFRWPQPS